MKIELSKWIIVDGYCATRVLKGTDPNDLKNRIAFIEKTGRVRIASYVDYDTDGKNWKGVIKGSGSNGDPEKDGTYGYDLDTRFYVDVELKRMGYTLNN